MADLNKLLDSNFSKSESNMLKDEYLLITEKEIEKYFLLNSNKLIKSKIIKKEERNMKLNNEKIFG